MSQHDAVTIRCWQLTGETALEDMVLGVDERAVRDGINVLSSDDFDACLAIVVCRIGPNFYAHLSQAAGHYKGDASGIWDRSRGSGAPEGTAYEIKPLTRIHRVPEALLCPIGLLSCTICSTWDRRRDPLQRLQAISVFPD